MSAIWISAATIARFAVAGSLMTLMAGGQSAPKAARTIVEQTSYFALPGLAEDVYRVRLHASDALENSVSREAMFFAARETRTRFPT